MTDLKKTQKIVIVEDDNALSDIYKTRLEALGYAVFPAYDGVQALAVIEHERPDLVLLDLMVPKKAGDQILEEMRESEWGKDIKVMIMSNLNEADAPRGLRNLGIEGYAVKANLSNDQLDQLVDVILQPVHQAEDVLLAGNSHEVVHEAPHNPENIPVSHPASGMSQAPTPPSPVEAVPAPAVAADIPPAPVLEKAAEPIAWPAQAPAASQTAATPPVAEPAPAAPAEETPADTPEQKLNPEDQAL